MTKEREPIPLKENLTEAVRIDYPAASQILVSFPDEWEVVQVLRRGENPLYIAGLPASVERTSRDHFRGLPAEVNLSLAQYRMYKLFQPWPMPSFLVGWNPETGSGKVLKAGNLKVQLQPIGQGQAWFGSAYGVMGSLFA